MTYPLECLAIHLSPPAGAGLAHSLVPLVPEELPPGTPLAQVRGRDRREPAAPPHPSACHLSPHKNADGC